MDVCLSIPGVGPWIKSLHSKTSSDNKHSDPGDNLNNFTEERIFTAEELSSFKGDNGGPIYLAMLGQVFDVSRGVEYYAPGGGYAFFSGIDGSRAFVTGEFTPEGLIDDITGLSDQDYLGLKEWTEFYAKDYKYIGKLHGRYYDAEGRPTEYWHQVQQWISTAESKKVEEDQFREKYPQCNVEYKPETGSRVWCSKSSGGIHRDWVGVPRTLRSVAANNIRCACVDQEDLDDPLLSTYPDCPQDATSCKLSN
nr:EOG090X0A5G [Sida crystallina]